MRTGCTCVRRPTWRATAWRRKDPTIRAKPASQTLRRRAWVSNESFIVSEAGASSTPIRWSTLVNALANDAATARMKTISHPVYERGSEAHGNSSAKAQLRRCMAESP